MSKEWKYDQEYVIHELLGSEVKGAPPMLSDGGTIFWLDDGVLMCMPCSVDGTCHSGEGAEVLWDCIADYDVRFCKEIERALVALAEYRQEVAA